MSSFIRLLISLFLFSHGAVHVWFVLLSKKLVKFQPEIGWTGESWLLTKLMNIGTLENFASWLFLISALCFVVAALAFNFQVSSWKSLLMTAAIFSSITIMMFWDGSAQMLVEKGVIGLLINLVIIIFLLK